MTDQLGSRLYAFGSNGAGQLGVGHLEDLTHPQLCHFASPDHDQERTNNSPLTYLPNNDQVKTLVAGGNHSLILTRSGRLYASGNNSDGRCGIENGLRSVQVFTAVAWVRNITHVAATWEASFIVEDAQIVWTCGSGSRGELGLGHDNKQSKSPIKLFDAKEVAEGCTIIDICAGMSHVVMVLSDGHTYGWGSCRRGQLGEGLIDAKAIWMPERLSTPFVASQVVCGRDFTFLRSPSQEFNLLGELKTTEGVPIDISEKDSEVVAGWSTLYVLNVGSARGFGQGRRGQLPPAEVPTLSKLVAGSEHCVALTDAGDVICWGWGEHGNCGLPLDDRSNVNGRFNKILIPPENGYAISGIGAGCATSFFWTSNHAS